MGKYEFKRLILGMVLAFIPFALISYVPPFLYLSCLLLAVLFGIVFLLEIEHRYIGIGLLLMSILTFPFAVWQIKGLFEALKFMSE